MKLADILNVDVIDVDLKAKDKNGIINELVDLLVKAGKITQGDVVIEAVLARENLMSTGIGHGVAIPHAKSDGSHNIDTVFNRLNQDNTEPIIVIAFGRSSRKIDFNAIDGEPVHLFFLLVASGESTSLHVKALARISRLLKHHYIRELLKEAKDAKSILEILKTEEAKHL
ncbi:MAG: PTS sugar transporter subunit IIA [Candidatus Desantisbacteria bacterium]